MPIARPAILWAIPGSAIMRDGADSGVIRVEYFNSFTEAFEEVDVPFPAAGTIDLGGYYYLSGDGEPDDLLELLRDALAGGIAGDAFDIDHDNAGQLTINNPYIDGGSPNVNDGDFRILAGHANTTVDLTHWGLDNTTTQPLVTAGTLSPADRSKGWFPIDLPEVHTLDALPIVAGGSTTISGKSRVIKIDRDEGRVCDFGWAALDAVLVRDEYAAASGPYSTFEYGWNESISAGFPFRYYPDSSIRTTTSYKTYRVRPEDGLSKIPWKEADESALFWDVVLLAIRTDDA